MKIGKQREKTGLLVAFCHTERIRMIEIPHGKGKGHWQRVLVDEMGDNPRWGAIVWCPECGRGLFAKDHRIADDGQISPSLGHPTEYLPCGWHVNPKLLGWSPVPTTPGPRAFNECAGCGFKSRSIGGWGVICE